MSALKSVQRAIGLLERDNTELAREALQEALAALEAAGPTPAVAIDQFVKMVVQTEPWKGLGDFNPMELDQYVRQALVDRGQPAREIPLDNYSHSVVCLVGFDTGEAHHSPAGTDDDSLRAQVLVEVVEIEFDRADRGLGTEGASVVVRDDEHHPSSFEFTLDTPERADAAITALQGARMMAFGIPPAGEVVGRT